LELNSPPKGVEMEEMAESAWAAPGQTEKTEDFREAAWISASQRGDVAAFNCLVLKWEKSIYNLAFRMLQSADEASEMTQEVFLKAYKNIRGFKRQARFSTWLFRIATNQCISRLRRRPSGVHFSLDDSKTETSWGGLLPQSPSHEEAFLTSETCRQVHQALRALPEEQRMIVELKFFQEMTFEEIGETLQAPLSTIKTRLYTALEFLKKKMGKTGLQPEGFQQR
jgi:RNA polymerase sigma-70 factor, ECF subfamily